MHLLGFVILIKKGLFSFTALSSIGNSNWYVFAILAMYSIVYISFKQCKKHSMTSCVLFTILYIILMDVIKDQAWWYNIILCYPAGMILSKYKDRVCSIINVNLKMYSFDHLRMYNIDHINTCCSRR